MPYEWDPEILDALARLGVRPDAGTPPVLVKDFITKLYRYELRRLRARLVDGEFPKSTYAGLVAALRPKYWPLSLPAARWAEPR